MTTATNNPSSIQPVHLLACYEDSSSFIHNKNSLNNSTILHATPNKSKIFTYAASSTSDSLGSPSSSNSNASSLVDRCTPSPQTNSAPEHSSAPNGYTSSGHFSSSSPSCISAFDYCHLSSSSSATNSYRRQQRQRQHKRFQSSSSKQDPQLQPPRSALKLNQQQQQQHHYHHHHHHHHHHHQRQTQQFTTNNAPDPVYIEDEQVFYNLIFKERAELNRRAPIVLQSKIINNCSHQIERNDNQSDGKALKRARGPDLEVEYDNKEAPLNGTLRHSLLSWMLNICEHQMCQDEIFPLASIILDKFLLFHPEILRFEEDKTTTTTTTTTDTMSTNNDMIDSKQQGNDLVEFFCNEDELKQRQLYLFAGCSLLLATKLRQTPRLSVQTLIESSRIELPVELNREEILDGELLILATLKWDLAALVTPNDFLGVLIRKCQHLFWPGEVGSKDSPENNNNNNNNDNNDNKQQNKANLKDKNEKLDDEKEEDEKRQTKMITTTVNTTSTTLSYNNCDKIDVCSSNQLRDTNNNNISNDIDKTVEGSVERCDKFRVRRHTQTLLELCLMGK